MSYNDNAIIGQMIRRIRQSLKITQKEMATKLSVTPQTISAWELGKRTLNQGDARRIFEKFDIDVNDYKKYLSQKPDKSIIRYCSKCGTLHTCPDEKTYFCCLSPTIPVNNCKTISEGCMVYLIDNNIMVTVFDAQVKYIAYIDHNSTDIVLCHEQHTPHANFNLKNGGNLYIFINDKGLFRIDTPLH